LVKRNGMKTKTRKPTMDELIEKNVTWLLRAEVKDITKKTWLRVSFRCNLIRCIEADLRMNKMKPIINDTKIDEVVDRVFRTGC
jgi:hypothetical protein